MGRPAKITDELAARIAELRAGGCRTRASLCRALAAEGRPVGLRTLAAWEARRGAAATVAAAPAPAPAAPAPAPTAAEVGDALDGDDLARLVAVRDRLERALGEWSPQLGREGTAVRAYATLSRALGETTARLVELRPRPEAEAERLAALGEAARAGLLARAAAGARPDVEAALRDRVAKLEGMIARHVRAGMGRAS